MTNKEKYIQLCKEKNISVLSEYWWYEKTSAGKQWDAIILEDESGNIIAAMPYHLHSKFGFRMMIMPQHTQFLSIYISDNAPKNIYYNLFQALDSICKQKHIAWCLLTGYFPQKLTKIADENGFSVSERVSYVIDSFPSGKLTDMFSENKRRQIKKFGSGKIEELTAEEFYSFHSYCLAQRKLKIDYSKQWATAVLNEAISRGQGKAMAVKNENRQILSAVFLLWDKKVCYYLLPTYNYTYRNSGAMAYLTEQAIRFAKEKGLNFDFEGSMQPSIALSYKQFGGKANTYYKLERIYNPILKLLLKITHRI